MSRSRKVLVLFLGILACGVAGYVAYRAPRGRSPFEENAANFEEHNPAIALAGKEIENAIEAYKREHGSPPVSLDDLHLTNLPNGVSTSSFSYSRPGGNAYMISVVTGGRIGVLLASNGDFRRIKAVLPNSPASKANVRAGDYILQIDGNDVSHLSRSDFISSLAGAPGTSVTISFRSETSGKTETVTLTREPDYVPVSFKPR